MKITMFPMRTFEGSGREISMSQLSNGPKRHLRSQHIILEKVDLNPLRLTVGVQCGLRLRDLSIIFRCIISSRDLLTIIGQSWMGKSS